jgi:hypothetical protein
VADNFPKPATIEIEGKEIGPAASAAGPFHFWESRKQNPRNQSITKKLSNKPHLLYDMQQLIHSMGQTRKILGFYDLPKRLLMKPV